MSDFVLPSRHSIPNLGLGTWYMGENRASRTAEIAALRSGIEYGARLIDTAEMYGEGEAEKIVGEAMSGYRDHLYLVSKFYPFHAAREQVIKACDRSLRRLNTDYLDLYLLHWRGSVPFEETLEALYRLKSQGKIRDYGVSNLDTEDMKAFCQSDVQAQCATNQVLYNLAHREAEWSLKPFCESRGISVMAYCPLDQGSLLTHPALAQLAAEHHATPAQIALAWLLKQPGVIAIPKSASPQRVKENLDSSGIILTDDDCRTLDTVFPPPGSPRQGRLPIR